MQSVYNHVFSATPQGVSLTYFTGVVLVATAFLQTVDLACERDWRLLFNRLNLSLNHGQMLQVCGPNGSGKTSLLRLLAGLMQPTAGKIFFQGVELARQREQMAKHSLWIGHAAGINGLLTAQENLAWLCALQHAASSEQILAALERAGLKGFHDVPVHTLSAGQQRRVALARLHLPSAPALWILDEPFTALDRSAVADLEQHLVQHCERGGMVVFTTHHELQRRSTQFCELDLGQRSA